MPKILKDMEDKIFTASLELFGEYGYKKVNMKMIAKSVGIAVGTLYNYYPNKEQLFLSVFENSWSDTVRLLNKAVIREKTADDKIRVFIDIFWKEIDSRKGLGRTLIMQGSDTNEEEYMKRVTQVENIVINCVTTLIQELEICYGVTINDGIRSRLAGTILLVTFKMKKQFPNEYEENMKFLKGIITSILKESFS